MIKGNTLYVRDLSDTEPGWSIEGRQKGIAFLLHSGYYQSAMPLLILNSLTFSSITTSSVSRSSFVGLSADAT